MTTYYLSSVDGSDASDGLSWDNAFASLKYAVETASAAASGPHTLLVDSAHSESLSAATTITLAGDLRVLSVSRGTGAPTVGAVVGVQASNYTFIFAGAFVLYMYGMEFRTGTGSTGSRNIQFGNTDSSHYELEQCLFSTTGSGASNKIIVGSSGNATNTYLKLINCVFKLNATSACVMAQGRVDMNGCSLDSAGSSPTTLFIQNTTTVVGGHSLLLCEGCDFSHVGSNTLIEDQAAYGTRSWVFSNCRIGTGTLVAAATVPHLGSTSAWFYNCSSGDNHYALAHYNAFGETTVSASVYANDGASYDGTNRCSWKIVTTANCSYYTPYVSPWMDVYHSGTSAISPYLEILRSGSTTKYQNDEVWGEFSYQGTSGSTKATFVNDRMTLLGTAADQTASSLGASDWTGEDATNNAFMKLEAGSITPAEIGHIRARVCVGEPSITVYVDPTIRW